VTVLTKAGMASQIQSDMGRTNAAAITAIGYAQDTAIRFYQKKRLWFNESRSITFSTVASTDTYTFNTETTTGTIGAQFYKIDGIWVTVSSTDVREIDIVDYTDLETDADQNTNTDVPEEAAYINRGLRFWPNPAAIYTIRIAGHLKLAAPATDGEADNPWMTEAYDLIMARTKRELYTHRWEDPQNATLMAQAEVEALNLLIGATSDKVRTGYIQPQSDF
jgi:hypothetical protein